MRLSLHGYSTQESDEINPPMWQGHLKSPATSFADQRPCAQETPQQQQQRGQAAATLRELLAPLRKRVPSWRNSASGWLRHKRKVTKTHARRNSLEAAKKAAEEAKSAK